MTTYDTTTYYNRDDYETLLFNYKGVRYVAYFGYERTDADGNWIFSVAPEDTKEGQGI